jgi:hypothetical protein
VLHPLNTTLTATMQWGFTLAAASQKYAVALRCSSHILSSYREYYHPFHPSTGLQCYIVGDLHAELADIALTCPAPTPAAPDDSTTAEAHRAFAIKAWTEAIAILSVSHGSSHPLVRQCEACIETVRP